MIKHEITSTDEIVRGYPGTISRCTCRWVSAWGVRDGSAERDGAEHLKAVNAVQVATPKPAPVPVNDIDAMRARLDTAEQEMKTKPGILSGVIVELPELRALLTRTETAEAQVSAGLEVADWIKDHYGDHISREIEERLRTALGTPNE